MTTGSEIVESLKEQAAKDRAARAGGKNMPASAVYGGKRVYAGDYGDNSNAVSQFQVGASWEVFAKTAQGQPAIYRDPATGEKYYSPYSTEYARGFRTESERFKFDSDMSRAPWVTVKDYQGNTKQLSRQEFDKLINMPDSDARFSEMQRYGLLDPKLQYIPAAAAIKQSNMRIAALKTLSAFRTPKGGIDMMAAGQAAASDRKIRQALYDIGVTNGDIKEVQRINAGVTSRNAVIKAQEAALAVLAKYKENDGYDLTQFLKDNPGDKKTLEKAGFSKSDISHAELANSTGYLFENIEYPETKQTESIAAGTVTPWYRQGKEPDPRDTVSERMANIREHYARNKTVAKAVWEESTPWNESKGEKATVGGAVIMAGELFVPGVYLARHWNELSAGQKAFILILEASTIALPLSTAAARGAKTVGTAGVRGRMGGALAGVGRESLAFARAPVDVILHPVATAKAGVNQVKALVTNLADPRKLPEAVITTSSGTVRLRVTEVLSEKQAMAIRDKLMRLAAKGEKPIIEMGGYTVELTRSPLMREVKGGVTHSTPSGEMFVDGLVVKAKPGMPVSEQGLFWAHEPAIKFSQRSAFGKTGELPTIIIADARVAKPGSTGKIYRLTAEMETKSPVGTKLPKADQILYTHIGSEAQKVEIRLIGKKLSPLQIAKLKAEGIVETIKAPFSPAIKVKNAKAITSDKQLKVLTDVLRDAGATAEARSAERAARFVRSARYAAPVALRAFEGAGRPVRADDPRSTAIERPVTSRDIPAPLRDAIRADYPKAEIIRIREERNEKGGTERIIIIREKDSRGRYVERSLRIVRDPRERKPERATTIRTTPELPARVVTVPVRFPRMSVTEKDETPRKRGGDGSGSKKGSGITTGIKGKLAWRQGELRGKDVYHSIEYPFTKRDHKITVGNPPAGARIVDGPLSAYRTIKLLYGTGPGNKLDIDIGAFKARISETGEKISFKPERITERTRLPGSRLPRITPKRAALR